MSERFTPHRLLRNRHIQTMWPTLFRRDPIPETQSEIFTLPDNDILQLDWADTRQRSLLVILHGLSGGMKSAYVRAMFAAARAQFDILLINARGAALCNKQVRTYHLGASDDIDAVLQMVAQRFPQRDLYCVGYSLGGNILLKRLGEQHLPETVRAAAAVSVPFDPALCVQTVNKGFARIYQRRILKSMKAEFLRKAEMPDFPFSRNEILAIASIAEWDDRVTAKINGYGDAAHYYAQTTCLPYLKNISTPTLLIHAADDPFMTPAAIPQPDLFSNTIEFELYDHGGHVGFIGEAGFKVNYWLEKRLLDWFSTFTSST